jgi:small-conductance mechanosensitive channel
MHIPKNYFHDRLVLVLLSINTFLAVLTTVLILLRLRGGNNEVLVQQYHANLGLSAFQTGGTSTFVGFIGFAALVLVLHTVLSLRTYHQRRDYSLAILWMGMLLLLLLLIVSNALAALR